MLPEGAIGPNPVGLDGVLDDRVSVHTTECRRNEGRVLGEQTLVEADARNVLQVRSSDRADTVDPGIEGREASPCHLGAVSEFGSGERVAEEQAHFSDSRRDTDDLW